MAQASTATVKGIKRDFPFRWEGRDKKGKRLKGRSLAPDEAALRADLRRQGIAVFSRQLAIMLAAGIPLVQGFEIVGAGHEKPAMQRLILDIKSDVEGGT